MTTEHAPQAQPLEPIASPSSDAPGLRRSRSLHLPAPAAKRAVVIGAGSFGTATAILLSRGGLRTALYTRTQEQARQLREDHENRTYLPGVELPRELRIDHVGASLSRADYVFVSVPSTRFAEALQTVDESSLGARAVVISLTKGLVPPDGAAPSAILRSRFGGVRTGCLGGPAHALEMVSAGAGLVAASENGAVAHAVAQVFIDGGVVCEESQDPVGVELAGVAKNAAALASGATVAQGLNAAGAAAGHIFAETWRWARALGAEPESMIGLAGTGDLVATALAPESRNRRAGELLSEGVPAREIPHRVGQAVEALETVPLLAGALAEAGLASPVTSALAGLIEGRLPLEEWVSVVRTTIPPAPRRRGSGRQSFWRRLMAWIRRHILRRSDEPG